MTFRSTFTFETVRSDYDNVMQILNEYIEQDRLELDKFETEVRDGTWIGIFTVSCSPNDYVDILGELMKKWLLIETWNGV